jgi:hypothetical protein
MVSAALGGHGIAGIVVFAVASHRGLFVGSATSLVRHSAQCPVLTFVNAVQVFSSPHMLPLLLDAHATCFPCFNAHAA